MHRPLRSSDGLSAASRLKAGVELATLERRELSGTLLAAKEAFCP